LSDRLKLSEIEDFWGEIMNRLLLACLVCVLTGSAYAHHAFTTHYNPRETMQLQGVITEFTFVSPHASLALDVESEDGSIKSWEVETTSPAHFRRMGVDQNTFSVGDEITLIAWPNRNPAQQLIYGLGFITEQGERYGQMPDVTVDSYSTQGASGVEKVAGRWVAPLPDNSSMQKLPLNAAGIAARDSYDPKNSPANNCEPTSIPSALYAPFLTDIQIGENEVVFHHEVYGTVRTIPLNAPPAQVEATGWFGIASARIVDDVLVVDSSDFLPSGWGTTIATHALADHTDIPSSLQKRLIERYSTSEDGLTLNLEYTLSDPGYLTEDYSATIRWNRVADDEPIYGYDCEMDSASRFSGD